MFIIRSTNPNLSFIISKNPNTQRSNNQSFTKSLRKGKIHGWFTNNDTEFRCLFIDSPTETSLINQRGDFEYLDRTRYASPYLPIGIITEMFRSATQEISEHDVVGQYSHSVEILIELSQRRNAESFIRHYTDVAIEFRELTGNLGVVSIASTHSLYQILNLVQVFCILQTLANDDLYIPMNDDAYTKYAKSLIAVDAPYHIRYMLAKTIQSPKVFDAVKDLIGTSSTQTITLNHGDAWQHRFRRIWGLMQGGDCLWDVGCGEMRYTRKLAGRYQQIVAFDADPEIQEANTSRLEKYQLENVTVAGELTPDAIQDLVPSEVDTFDILATEVIEHIDMADAEALLSSLAAINFRRLVITVPNREFNIHYLVDGFRHDDHKWEPTASEFEALICRHFADRRVIVEGLGDSVDNVHASLIAIVDRI